MALTIDILDVGQGDGIFIQFPTGKCMLVDLGSTRNIAVGKNDAMKYFKEHTKFGTPRQTLDYLVLTHGDRDHYNLVSTFTQTFDVNVLNVIHGGLRKEYGDLIPGLVVSNQLKFGTTPTVMTDMGTLPCAVGSEADFGASVSILCMSLLTHGSLAHMKNSRSVVMRIAYAGVTFMLTGDATRDTEKFIVGLFTKPPAKPTDLASDVLKIDHHGSRRTSSWLGWILSVNPIYTFVCSDRDGALDPAQKVSGHRLPQMLTFSLHEQYGSRLAKDCVEHSFVASWNPDDYAEYNAAPDLPGKTVKVPDGVPAGRQWLNPSTTAGFFSTLQRMGVEEGEPDVGVQYRLEVDDAGTLTVYSTDAYEKFAEEAHVSKGS